MVSRSSRSATLDGSLGRRRSPGFLGVILVGTLLLCLGPQLHGSSIVPLPFILGLAARGGADREPTLERLAGELETFVSRVRDGEVNEAIADPDADAEGVDFELDRDDALGRLSTAIDELTTAVRERERRFGERERELRETNERLEAVIEASPAALVALDTDETVTLWNPAAKRIFGWSEAEVLGESLPFVPDDRAEGHREIFDRLFEGESIAGLETQRVTKAGERIDVSISAAPIYGADGEIVGTMGAIEDITDRKERERRLEATSARLEALFERSPDMIDVLDTEGAIVGANQRLCDKLGYTESELVGTKIWEHAKLFDAGEVTALLDDVETGERRKFEDRYRRHDGTTFPVEVHLIRLDLAEENRFLAISRDISDRKARERDLRETKRRLELALEGTNTGVWEWRLDSDNVSWDETSEAFIGLEAGELEESYEAFRQRVHPDDWPRVAAALERAVDGDELYQAEFRMRHEGGDWRWFESRGRVVDDDGVTRLVGTRNDITDRKERERELERYREYTDDLLDAVDDVFYVLDADGDLQRWNESLSAVTGYADAEIESMDALDFFAEADRATIADAIAEVLETGSTRVEAPIQTVDGETIPYEFVATRLEDLDGNTVVTGIARDISERKRYERDLERTTELLEQAQRLASVGGWELDVREEPFEAMASDEFYRQLGLEPGTTLTPADAIERFHPDDRPALRAVIEAAIEDGESYDLEARVRLDDGEERWVRAIGEPVRDGADEIVAVRGSMQDVTEGKARERDLERTTRLLEQSQRLSNVGAWELDVREESPTVQWTDEVARIHGLSPEADVDLEHAVEFYHPEDRDEVRAAIERAIERGESYDLEARIEPADDSDRRWVRTIGEPVSEDGRVVKLYGSLQDVTDRKERERDLQRYETIIQAIGDPVYTLDESGRVQFVNDAIETLAGYDPDALIGDDVSELLPPPDLERAREQVRELLREDEPYGTVETNFATADGDVIETETHVALLPMDDGEFAGTAGVVRDITERKERERELERYETIIQAIGDPVYTLDASGTFRFVNDAIESLSGHDPETLIGADVATVMSPENLETARELVRELLREGKPYETFEMDLETADGDVIEAENHMALLPSEDGEFAGTAGVVRDITERKERERELERTTELLEQAQRIAGVGGWELDVTTEPYELTLTPQLERLFGRVGRAETLDVEDAVELYHPDDRSRVLSAVDDAVEHGESYDLEVRMHTPDDEIQWVRTIGEPIADDGEVVAVRGSIQDITDRKRRERELERTTDLLERVQRMASIGGWEVNVRADPSTSTWTDEMYRLHDLPSDVTPDLEQTIECYHPDDRAFVREQIEAAIETETGYDLEARIRTSEGEIRWVRAISEPIRDEAGELHKYRGTVQDISDRKRRELALESLHETARGLLNAETESTVADLVVDTAADLLETGDVGAGVYLLDSETNRFEPVSSTANFADRSGGAPSVAVGDGDSVLWTTYVTGTQTVVDDAEIGDRSPLFGGDAPGGLLVPIGDYGVFVLLASPATIDDETRRLFETLVATTEAAFDRLESEANLRERDAELAAQNRRLRRQIQITEIIRGIDRSLIGADGRDEIERTVPERLVAADNVSFAWIGDLDASGSTLEARTWAGDEPEYLDAVDFGLEGESQEPAVRAARTGSPTVVENVVEDFQGEAWRTNALDAGFQSAIAVPLTFEEYSYGVLTVYADEPDAFTDLERSVFAELGEGIASAINAAQTREALHAETLVELTLDLETDDVLSRIATATGAAVTYEGLGTHGESEAVIFFETRGASAEAVRDVLDDLVSVTSARLVTESDSRCLFEATVTGDVLATRLVRHGGSPRSIAVDEGRTEVTVDVPVTTDVREFVEMLRDQYERVDLRSRRHVQRTMHTRQELVTSLFEDLTDRQLEVLRTAYLAGFFEWPRESTGEEIAEMLEVTQPTVNRHLRIGQQRLLERLFDDETLSVADGS
ncbi:putative PAS/PAC sensor protein [Haloterrigena turkmenica DSM 5511]|uniref:histidine kinase n=1 Tax=Haloterrigena turkmenica (strain ATCC 51198 / DSM 5511 / JCM 9101 / NCIMB 13204 / VKM B-1734 / 4k) TaxID=543526 RepID=D2RTK8_HALTV|nr:PAS domain S-box protein [Haloterrigena turkmenica]ADB59051.1 putative PAS/PAC sensor protein [Haloterrigena turkmenica DSM 5511]